MDEKKEAHLEGVGNLENGRNHNIGDVNSIPQGGINVKSTLEFLELFEGPILFKILWDKAPEDKTHPSLNFQALPHQREEVLNQLISYNLQGYGVFFMPNQGQGLSTKDEHITKIRAVFADLDGSPVEPTLDFNPHAINQSSPGRYHAYWKVSDLPVKDFKAIQKKIALCFNGDRAVSNPATLMRLPGFLHNKKEPVLSTTEFLINREPIKDFDWLPELPKEQKEAEPNQYKAEKYTKGKRDSSLTSHGGYLWNGQPNFDLLLGGLKLANQILCEPPLEESEVLKIAKSVSKMESSEIVQRTVEGAEVAERLLESRTKNNKMITTKDLFKAVNLEGFKVRFLDDFSFPGSGVIVHGAKTGGGKTTFQVNIAREALLQGKKVCWVTYELNADDFVTQLALSLYALHDSIEIKNWNRKCEGPGVRINNIDRIKFELPEQEEDSNPEFEDTFQIIKTMILKKQVPNSLQEPLKKVFQFIDDEKLLIYEYPKDVSEVKKIILDTDADMYLIDYLQVIPPPEGVSKETYKGTQAVCHVFRELGNHGGKLIFLGAQFNRQAGEENQKGAFDPRLEQFREAADIEQMASIALGIGYQDNGNGKREFFYKILKHRYAGRMANAKIKSFGFFEYYLALRGGRWLPGDKWITPNKPRRLGANQVVLLDLIENSPGMDYDKMLEAFKRMKKQKSALDETLNGLLARELVNQEGHFYFANTAEE